MKRKRYTIERRRGVCVANVDRSWGTFSALVASPSKERDTFAHVVMFGSEVNAMVDAGAGESCAEAHFVDMESAAESSVYDFDSAAIGQLMRHRREGCVVAPRRTGTACAFRPSRKAIVACAERRGMGTVFCPAVGCDWCCHDIPKRSYSVK